MSPPKSTPNSSFPDDFLWGASTAAYQVEGGLANQWSEWERDNAGRLASNIPKELKSMPEAERQARGLYKPENYVNGASVEHYARYKEDFALLEQLNFNSFRFGIAWERVEPNEGQWDEAALLHYKHYIAELKRRGIEPIPTLWHWTMPLWFAAKGGFENKQNIRYFERFAAKVAEEFGAELRYVLTINEPNVYASISYMLGFWPPQRKNPLIGIKVLRNLVAAHRAAYTALTRRHPTLQVGLAYNFAEVKAHSPRNPVNRLVVHVANSLYNYWFLDCVTSKCDFIGVNWYHTQYINWLGRDRNPEEPQSDLRWYMEPTALKNVLVKAWRRYRKPLLITENGLADSADNHRKWWLEQTLQAMQSAMGQGVTLLGYLHWSLLDNFEWAYGWWPKFGLVAVDREHGMKRTVRASATWFAKQIAVHRKR
jgi:beta-glucosidase